MSLTNKLFTLLLAASAGLSIAGRASADPSKQECVDANERIEKLRSENKLRAARDAARLCSAASCGKMTSECAQTRLEIEKLIPTIVFEGKSSMW